MIAPEFTVYLDEEACALALSGADLEGIEINRRARAALERGKENAALLRVREITCTPAEAIELDEYFRQAAEILAWRKDPRGRACERARRSLRYALRRASRWRP